MVVVNLTGSVLSPVIQSLPQAMDASPHMCTNECVGTLHSSGGRMPFPHPSPSIISRPMKQRLAGACGIKQWWAGSSLQSAVQTPGGCPWAESWASCKKSASGGQLIREGHCDMTWCTSSNHNQREAWWLDISFDCSEDEAVSSNKAFSVYWFIESSSVWLIEIDSIIVFSEAFFDILFLYLLS